MDEREDAGKAGTPARDEELVALLRRMRILSHLLYHRFSPNASQHRVLRILREEGGKTQKELACRLEIRPASLSEVLAKLEKAGLIERERLERDRRNCVIRITENGLADARAHDRDRTLLSRRLFRTLDRDEEKALAAILDKLAADWEKGE